MTFSDSRVVGIVRDHFEAVWESVAPVSIAVFDLGDGRSVRGTMGGEIALYFCRPDGRVFDILPALHSPHVTYWAIRNALEFYQATGATDEAIAAHHRLRLEEMGKAGRGLPTPATQRAKRDIASKGASKDEGTKALGVMAFSKSGGFSAEEPMAVVEPGGLELYKRQVHEAMGRGAPRTPAEWKEHVFTTILEMELKGGEFRYDVDTLAPISIIEE